MPERILIRDEELKEFAPLGSYADKAKALLEQQKSVWDLCKTGYGCLSSVIVKEFEFDHFAVKVQFNPGRITSSTAKVDPKSIKERKCFLCIPNLPAQQKGILFEEDYAILCNPFPIFNEHFTLPNINHVDQRISVSFDAFLKLGKAMGDRYTIFYNGPKCGASAPDHLHFQAGDKYFMPIDSEYDIIKNKLGKEVYLSSKLEVHAVDKYVVNFISMESSDADVLKKAFAAFLDLFNEIHPNEEEPMLNIISNYQGNKWRVLLFPREKHRPSCFFAEGDDNITISPASVDMGGFLITPMEKDFNKITKEDIIKLYNEVTLNKAGFEKLTQNFVEEISKNKL